MKRKIKLLDSQIKIVEFIPENGMGYHIVDLELEGGIELLNRIVLNSTYLQLNENEVIDPKKIKKIKPHGRKYFR